MLTDARARAYRYDSVTDTATLAVRDPDPGARTATATAMLLLDGAGHLVGVDLGGEGPGRVVVLLGRHEDVASTRSARVTVTRCHGGAIARVVVADAKHAYRAADPNPYVA